MFICTSLCVHVLTLCTFASELGECLLTSAAARPAPMTNVQVQITSLAVMPCLWNQGPGRLKNGAPCIHSELHQIMLFRIMYSNDSYEVMSGCFVGRGMARDCYSVDSSVLGKVVFKLQDASRAVRSSGIEALLAIELCAQKFVLPVLWYSDQLTIELNGKIGKWTVIAVPQASGDVEQVLEELVSHDKTDALLGAVNNVVRAILLMFVEAFRAGLMLNDVHLRNLAFDGDPMAPSGICIRILDFKLCEVGEVGKTNGRMLLLGAVLDALLHIASLLMDVSWSSCASDIVHRIIPAMHEFTDEQWLSASHDALLAPVLITENPLDMMMPSWLVERLPHLRTSVGCAHTKWIMPQPANQMASASSYARVKHVGCVAHDVGSPGSGSNSSSCAVTAAMPEAIPATMPAGIHVAIPAAMAAPAAVCQAMSTPAALVCHAAMTCPAALAAVVAHAVARPYQLPPTPSPSYPVNPMPPPFATLHQPSLATAKCDVGVPVPTAVPDSDGSFPLPAAEPVAADLSRTVSHCVHLKGLLDDDDDAECRQQPLKAWQDGPFNSERLDHPLCSSTLRMDQWRCSGADPGLVFESSCYSK